AQGWRRTRALKGIRVEADTDETQLVDGSVEFGQRFLDRRSSTDGQPGYPPEALRVELNRLLYDVVVCLDPPVHHPFGLYRVHLLVGPWREQLDIGSHAI